MNKKYFIIYFIANIFTFISLLICNQIVGVYSASNNILVIFLIAIPIALLIGTIILLLKKKPIIIKKKDLRLPIMYLVFFIIVVLIAVLFNRDAIIPYIHFTYYLTLLYIPIIIINTYTLLLFRKK